MSNTLIIIMIILYTIWCYKHEDESFKKSEKDFSNLYRGHKPPQKMKNKPPHLQQPKLPHERIKVNKPILPPTPTSSSFQEKRFWRDTKVIALLAILIVGSIILFFLIYH